MEMALTLHGRLFNKRTIRVQHAEEQTVKKKKDKISFLHLSFCGREASGDFTTYQLMAFNIIVAVNSTRYPSTVHRVLEFKSSL